MARSSSGLVPLVFLPTAIVAVLLGGAASGLSFVALLSMIRTKTSNVARRVSRRLSRSLTGGSTELVGSWFSSLRRHQRHLLRATGLLVFLRAALKLRKALQDFDPSIRMNDWDAEVDGDIKKRLAVHTLPKWGAGVKILRGHWKPYLLSHASASENLMEIHGMLGLVDRRCNDMTIDQITEGVRRILLWKYGGMLNQTSNYWSEEQARSIAQSLANDAGLAVPLPEGGVEECMPIAAAPCIPSMPYMETCSAAPEWLLASQRFSLDSLRPFFHVAFSLKSRFIDTPFGKLHVLDSHPPSGNSSRNDQPPLLLQHGAFVTGWSMALLGWFLSRQGRRVVVPDLFDFDHSYSASDPVKTGGTKVRRFDEHLESLALVVRDLAHESVAIGGSFEVDLVGHSFGGIVVPKLANLCARQGYPVRKVVMLAPGGPLISINRAEPVRFLKDPGQILDNAAPSWVPTAPLKAATNVALSILFSPNNINSHFGFYYEEYLGNVEDFGTDKPTLLLWGSKDSICVPRRGALSFFKDRFPHSEGYWVEGGDHNIQLDSVVSVARAIDSWLEPHGRSTKNFLGWSMLEKALLFTARKLTPIDFTTTPQVGAAFWNLAEGTSLNVEAAARSKL